MRVALLDSLKALGKQIGWVRTLNSQIKSARLKQEYDRTIDHYSGRRQTNADLWARLASRVRATTPLFARGGRARLFFLGTDELQDRGGILQALDRLADLASLTWSDPSLTHNFPRPPSEP